jgi:hypothetical protein
LTLSASLRCIFCCVSVTQAINLPNGPRAARGAACGGAKADGGALSTGAGVPNVEGGFVSAVTGSKRAMIKANPSTIDVDERNAVRVIGSRI